MTDRAAQHFDREAADYDAPRRRLVPPFDGFYGAAVAALELSATQPRSVLDLGAGTGLLTQHVLAARPDVRPTLFDGAPAMLDRARERLGDAATYVVGDLHDAPPPGPWEAVVSALAIHHLEDDAKRALFARVHGGLVPGGVFVNAEQVLAPTARLQAHYRAWHEREAKARGATDAEWDASVRRMRHDRWATVADQLDWLRAAGFPDAACLFADHCFAVLVARRSG
jgi:tRNA (cmo5U34)-methyltransferase